MLEALDVLVKHILQRRASRKVASTVRDGLHSRGIVPYTPRANTFVVCTSTCEACCSQDHHKVFDSKVLAKIMFDDASELAPIGMSLG